MKQIFKVFCLLCILFSLTACQKKTVVLEIKVTYWSDIYPGEAGFPYEEFTFEVKVGDVIEIPMTSFYDSLTIKITAITNSEIKFETSEALCIKTEAGTHMNTVSKKFAFPIQTPFYLATPTMDAGVTFEFIIK